LAGTARSTCSRAEPALAESGCLCHRRTRFTEYRLFGTYREPRLFNTAADGLLTVSAEQQFRSSFAYRRNAITAQARAG
jgi:hypothetical protein